MTDRLALVTGAARGIGAAISAAMSAQGWRVAGFDRAWPDGTGARLAAKLQVDVTDFRAWRRPPRKSSALTARSARW